MKPKKSQSALEFLVLAGFMMLFFVIFFSIAGEKIIDMNNARRDKVAGDIMDTVISELELAQSSMDGYTRNFTMPEYIEGNTYEIHISSLGEGKNVLSLRYMDKLYDGDININLDGTANAVYKGINQVTKRNGRIRILNGDDPCNTVTAGDKSICLGGKCYCMSGNYAYGYSFGDPANICKYENDVELTKEECPSGCRDFDYCNPPPAILPGATGDITDPIPVTDTKAVISFTANESAKARIMYGEMDALGNCAEFNNLAAQNNPSTIFNIPLTDLHAGTRYCFEIYVEDAKGAKQYYPMGRLSQSSFSTSIDDSSPVVRYAYLYPPLSAYAYGNTIELILNITDDSGLDLAHTKAAIKQKVGDNLVDVALLSDFRDKVNESTCGIAPTDLGNQNDDSGYIKCFRIDSAFAKYASYGIDADTLFYASYDVSTAPEKGAIPSSSSGVDIVEGRYGNGAYISLGDMLRYPAAGAINSNEGTIEFWVKKQWGSTDTAKKTFFDAGSDSSNGIDIERIGGNLLFRIIDSNAPGVVHSINPGQPFDENWHFISAVWKNIGTSDSEMRLYFDGIEIGSIPGEGDKVTIPLADIAASFGIGDDLTENYKADSIIDQFRIISKAKSAGEITADYGTAREYHLYLKTQDMTEPPHAADIGPDKFSVSSFPVSYGTG